MEMFEVDLSIKYAGPRLTIKALEDVVEPIEDWLQERQLKIAMALPYVEEGTVHLRYYFEDKAQAALFKMFWA